MRPSVWFIVPAHGRLDVARACLRQLRRTCDEIAAHGVHASAVVIAEDANLDTAQELGFGTVERANRPLGRKWNDGYELAGRAGVDYVIPFGTDDWIDAELVYQDLPAQKEIRCSRLSSVVSEDGRRIAPLRIPYDGGDGVRIIPTALLRPLRYRPAVEDAPRAIDTSVFMQIAKHLGRKPEHTYLDLHAWQIVDWKSPRTQLNSYEACLEYQAGPEADPWETLADVYPAEALADMAVVYGVEVRA